MEQWLDIKEYEGKYQVSDQGRIKSLARCRPNVFGGEICMPERIMREQPHYRGYRVVFLYQNGKMVKYFIHRLVACAFLPNHAEKNLVNHIDSDKTNNRLSNLEWATESENTKHYYSEKAKRMQVLPEEIEPFDPEDLPF